jgi:hypothetical protein
MIQVGWLCFKMWKGIILCRVGWGLENCKHVCLIICIFHVANTKAYCWAWSWTTAVRLHVWQPIVLYMPTTQCRAHVLQSTQLPFLTRCLMFSVYKLRPDHELRHTHQCQIIKVLHSKYSGASVHKHLSSWTNRFTNKFSGKKKPRVTNGVLSNEHTSRQQQLATSWEYQQESVSCCITFTQYTSLLKFAIPSLEFHCVLWFFYVIK